MKELYLKKIHEDNGAKFGEFAGTNMPLMYAKGVMREHLHVRKNVGLFDISHMQIIEVKGKNATDFLELCLPLKLQSLTLGKSKYSFLLNEKAGIIDDLIVTKLSDNNYYLVVNASNAEKDFAHLMQHKISEVEVNKLERVILALQGPEASNVLQQIGFEKATDLSFMEGALFNNIFITRSGYTGEDGFELALPLEVAEIFIKTILEIESVELIGLAARDSLRLEAGLCLHGNDINQTINPVEADLLWAIPKELRTDNAKYIGAKALEDFIKIKPLYTRVGFLPLGKQPVRAGATIHNKEGKQIGRITSGSFGSSINAPISMGYIERDYKVNPTTIYAMQRSKTIELQISKLPFVEHKYKK